MSIFSEIKLKWGDKEYTIAPDNVMQCIAKVEDVVTLAELGRMAEKRTLPLAKLAAAFAVVLEHAGARVSAEDVYAGMFSGGDGMQIHAQDAVTTLLVMMIPPDHLKKTAEEAGKGKEKAADVPL